MLRLGRFRRWATTLGNQISDDVSAPIPRFVPEGSTLAPLRSRANGPARTLTRRGDAAVAVPRNVAPSTVTRDTLSGCSNATSGVVSRLFSREFSRHPLGTARRANPGEREWPSRIDR
jgi:hypothetical protein